jgi:ankyrin repeat protein
VGAFCDAEEATAAAAPAPDTAATTTRTRRNTELVARPQLVHAARSGTLGMVRLLLEAGSDPNGAVRQMGGLVTPLAVAAEKTREIGVFEALLGAGADPNAASRSFGRQKSPLLLLADRGPERAAEALEHTRLVLRAGADPVRVPDERNGAFPLWVAAVRGAAVAVEAMLAHTPDADTLKRNTRARGQTSLHAAAASGSVETVRLLAAAAARADGLQLEDDDGKTARDLAASDEVREALDAAAVRGDE